MSVATALVTYLIHEGFMSLQSTYTYESPLPHIIESICDVTAVSISQPLCGPTYSHWGWSGRQDELCIRIDWTRRDGRKMFCFVEPVQEKKRVIRGTWLSYEIRWVDEPIFQDTLDEIIVIITSSNEEVDKT